MSPKEETWGTRQCSSQGQEVLRAVDGFAEALEEGLEIAVVVDEVDVAGVDDEQIAGAVVEEVVLVRGDDLFDVFVADGALARDAFAPEALLQDVGRGLEVD